MLIALHVNAGNGYHHRYPSIPIQHYLRYQDYLTYPLYLGYLVYLDYQGYLHYLCYQHYLPYQHIYIVRNLIPVDSFNFELMVLSHRLY